MRRINSCNRLPQSIKLSNNAPADFDIYNPYDSILVCSQVFTIEKKDGA